MPKITVRLVPALDEALDNLSNETGILKSNLILLAINAILRNKKPYEPIAMPSSDENLRTTLRIPDHLKAMLEAAANEKGCAANTLINTFVSIMIEDYGTIYKEIAK